MTLRAMMPWENRYEVRTHGLSGTKGVGQPRGCSFRRPCVLCLPCKPRRSSELSPLMIG